MKVKYHRFLLYLLLRASIWIIAAIPRSLSQFIFARLGACGYFLLTKERAKVLKHLRFAYKESLDQKQATKIAKGVFVHFSQMMADLIFISQRPANEIPGWVLIDANLEALLEKESKKNQGVIVVSAHFGNWELLGPYLKQRFLENHPVQLVAKRIYYERFNRLLVRFRARFELETVYRDTSFKSIFRAIKNQGWLGVLADQDIDSIPGIFVEFFGHEAYTTTGPAKIAYATGAPILPLFLVREGNRYRLIAGPSILPQPAEPKEAEIRRLTEALTQATEHVIRKYPEQWAWMHRRWKTQKTLVPV